MNRLHRARLALMTLATLALAASCDENLPSGPPTFSAGLAIVVTRDTIVVGDTSRVTAKTTDGQGRVIKDLTYNWTSADTNLLGFATINPANVDAVAGRERTLVGKRPGRVILTMTLPDGRFVTGPVNRAQTVVVGGVRVLSTHDSTLTAINDTATAIATSLVRVGGALVNRASQGIRWTHIGDRATVVGTGDTIRYISKNNGVDTLIASHDFCLSGAKCADTVFVRVNQQLTLTLSNRLYQQWSFYDSIAPTITLADRRGSGQAGAFIRFFMRSAFDSSIVTVIPGPFGVSNPTTGLMATPRVRTSGNGFARVIVQGVSANGVTVFSTDSFSVTVRQVARRVAAEPQRAVISSVDSISIRGVARDARGAPIADASVDLTASNIPFSGFWAGPAPAVTSQTSASITPAVTGVALPGNNPGAPQTAVFVDASVITILPPDSVKAGLTTVNVSTPVLDSLGNAAFGTWVRFAATGGATIVDSTQVDFSGSINAAWTMPNVVGTYQITAVRSAPQLVTRSDSAGRIVIRRSMLVYADVPDAGQSTLNVANSAPAQGASTVVTVTVRDRFGNIFKNAAATDFSAVASVGTLGAFVCTQGVCTATYTAPNAAGPASISVLIGATNIVFSPWALTIP